ncbi:hypothetical protein AOLI_G00216890 [Acnodon oligacanthus]
MKQVALVLLAGHSTRTVTVCELLFPHHKPTGVTAVAQLQLTVHFKLAGTVGSKGWSGQRSEHQGQWHLSSLSTQHGSDELA